MLITFVHNKCSVIVNSKIIAASVFQITNRKSLKVKVGCFHVKDNEKCMIHIRGFN